MSTEALTLRINKTHEALLAEEGVSVAVAEANGCYSVANEAELPEEFAGRWDGPGLIFVHHRFDGTTVPQYRPDAPTRKDAKGRVAKYLLPTGSGNSPYIYEGQRHLLNRPVPRLVIEGTKALLSVITVLVDANRLEDFLIISVAGAWGGVSGGKTSEDWIDLVPTGSSVTVSLDADWKTNPDVYAAATFMQGHLKGTALAGEVKFAKVPVVGKNGISDWLGPLYKRDPMFRFTALSNLVKGASANLGRKPAKRTAPTASPTGVQVYPQLKVTGRATVDPDTGIASVDEIFLGASIVPTAVYANWDDMADEPKRTGEFDLEVRIPGYEEVFPLKQVAGEILNNPRRMMSMIPRALGETVSMRPRSGEDIGEAIRAAAGRAGMELPVKLRIARSGWFEHEEENDEGEAVKVWRYVTGDMAIGPKDTTDEVTGKITESSLKKMIMANPFETSEEDLETAVAAHLNVGDTLLVDSFPWIAGTGFTSLVAAGIESPGGLAIVGTPSSGKTVIARTLMACQVPGWENLLANFEGSTFFVSNAGKGAHHAMVGVDDFRNRDKGSHAKKADQQRDGRSR